MLTMPTPLDLLTDEDITRSLPTDEEASFGSLCTTRGHLPLQAMDVQARIDGLLVEVELTQTFVNTLDEPLEATYIFPLPDRAAVTRFRMEVGGRVIEGMLKERGEARRVYTQAIQAGHRAAITEEERPGVFTMRVGNLMPGDVATVRLSLSGPLIYEFGEVTFRFPLVVAPRYIPGTPLSGPSVGDGVARDTDAVPDASRISPPVLLPGYPNPVHLSLSVEIEPSEMPGQDLRSSLHAILEERAGGVRRLVLQPGERLDRDFILRFRFGGEGVQTALSLKPDTDGGRGEGTFMLTLVPPVGLSKGLRPRDVVFVLDRSGSMAGWKMVAARRALARMVNTLNERDRFTIYAFDNQIETPPDFPADGLTSAGSHNRFRASEYLAKVEARGGTEMTEPLDQAVQKLMRSSTERQRILVLVTDGQVGNEDQILNNLGKRVQNIRIFTLGIDKAVNAAFLRRLADLGSGLCELVESEERLEDVMDKVHRCIGTPVLTGLRLEASGFEILSATLTPERLPDLFGGAPVVITGRYRGVSEGTVKVQGSDVEGRPLSLDVPARVSNNPALAALWARGRVRELEDRFVTGKGNTYVLEKEITATSLRFGVLSRFTAFVAVDKKQVVNEGGAAQQVTQPVETPAGWKSSSKVLGGMPLQADIDALRDSMQLAVDVSPLEACEIPPRGVPESLSAPKARAHAWRADEEYLPRDASARPGSHRSWWVILWLAVLVLGGFIGLAALLGWF
jgi:Ca-activated chloride channel family protein